MGKKAPETPARTVISWLRSPAGEAWSENRISSDLACWGDGVFADVVPDSLGETARTRWPVPLECYDLDDDGNG